MTSDDASADGVDRVVIAIDRAIGRLATDVARLDGIDLDAPWSAGESSRRDRIAALIGDLDPDAVPSLVEHGHEASTALVHAWSTHRDAASSADADRHERLLVRIHETHVALDVGVHAVDLPSLDDVR